MCSSCAVSGVEEGRSLGRDMAVVGSALMVFRYDGPLVPRVGASRALSNHRETEPCKSHACKKKCHSVVEHIQFK